MLKRELSLILFILFTHTSILWAEQIGEASWYSKESVLKEGNSGVMANGQKLDDEKLTCASWDFALGQRLLITNLDNGRQAGVICTDRGPAKWLVKKGRILDLSKMAFSQLDKLEKGVIKVRIEKI